MKSLIPVSRLSFTPHFWLYLSFSLTAFIFSFPITSIFLGDNGIASANTNIMVDPYNDSSFEAITIESPSTKINSATSTNKSLTISTENSSIGEVFINGNPTPPPPNILTGNLTKSNNTLPQIPSLSEPYRKPEENQGIQANTINNSGENSNLSSVSVSPFDETPNNNEPNLSQVRTINTSGNINNSPNSTNSNPIQLSSDNNNSDQNSTSTTILNNNQNKRRSLNDILVFSSPSENNSPNENKNVVSATTNTISSLSTPNNDVYKVLVKVSSQNQESQIKSLYPDAFRTNLQGRSMLQVGVFRTKEKAQEVSQGLENNGFQIQIIN